MEPVTILLGLAAIVVHGALTKAGENITDETTKRLFSFLKRKAPDSSTVKAIEAGTTIDYGKAYLELEPLAKDAEAIALFEAVKEQVEANPELAEKVEKQLTKVEKQLKTVIENWHGINIKDGKQIIKDNTFIFGSK